MCPSDGLGGDTSAYIPGGLDLGTYNHSNYLAFFGDRNYGGGLPQAVSPNRRAAFGINYGARLAEIQQRVDGLDDHVEIDAGLLDDLARLTAAHAVASAALRGLVNAMQTRRSAGASA